MTPQTTPLHVDRPDYSPAAAHGELSMFELAQLSVRHSRRKSAKTFIALMEKAVEGQVSLKSALENLLTVSRSQYVNIHVGNAFDTILNVELDKSEPAHSTEDRASSTLSQFVFDTDNKKIGRVEIARSRQSGPYQSYDRQYLDEITTRLGPAFLAIRTLKHHLRDFYLNRWAGTRPACVVNVSGIVQDRNSAFSEFAKQSGLFAPFTDRLSFKSPQIQSNIFDSFQTAAAALGKRNIKISDGLGTVIWIELHSVRLPAHNDAALDEFLLVFRTETQATALDQSLAMKLFDLTPAEADVAAALYAGLRPRDIASHRGVAVSTVRSLLKGINAKLDVNSQIGAVAKLRTHCQVNLALDFHEANV